MLDRPSRPADLQTVQPRPKAGSAAGGIAPLAVLAHDLASRLDGSLRSIRHVSADLAQIDGDHARGIADRLARAEAALLDMARVLGALLDERGPCEVAPTEAESGGRSGGHDEARIVDALAGARSPKASSAGPSRGATDAARSSGRAESPGSVAATVAAILAEQSDVARDARILVMQQVEPAVAAVPADGLAPILRVAVRNAMEASSATGRRQVQVIAYAHDDRLRVDVCDSGGGPGEKPRGRGIGLAGAQQLARRFGGTVVLEARAGGGSVLRITLPLGRWE